MIQKVILFGRTGMLGRYIYSYLKGKVPIICPTFRLTSSESLKELEPLLLKHHCNHSTLIINCIGLIPQRVSEDAQYNLINTEFPLVLAALAKKIGANMIHPTTDCVYDGLGAGEYKESSPHTETNPYGRSKSAGEPTTCTVIRTSIIGRELNNQKSFMEWVLQQSRCATIKGYTNHFWNGITCLQFAKMVWFMIENDHFWVGARHIFSPEHSSKYDMAKMIAFVFDRDDITINAENTSQQINKTLNTEWCTNTIMQIPSLLEQICDLKSFTLLE
jgi:dTDP-4-dehydrorhamnose reductase